MGNRLKGYGGGALEVNPQEVGLLHSGWIAKSNGLKDVWIEKSQITDLEFKAATVFINGYLEVVPSGGTGVRSMIGNTKNSLAVIFTRKQQTEFEAAYHALRHEIHSRPTGGEQAPAVASRRPGSSYGEYVAAKDLPPDGKRTQNDHALYALIASAVVVIAIWLWLNPILLQLVGWEIPWWALLLAYMFLAGGTIQELAKQKATENVAYGEVQVRTRPVQMPITDELQASSAIAPSDAKNEKTCPKCAEQVKAAAQVCRYCRHSFT